MMLKHLKSVWYYLPTVYNELDEVVSVADWFTPFYFLLL